jgi:hypothetical protein
MKINRCRLASAAALLAAIALAVGLPVALSRLSIGEAAMFASLRQATAVEAQEAQSALGDLQYDRDRPPKYDTYVATSNFRTVYSGHPIVVLMRPGVKWQGGPLGNTTLVMQLTRAQFKAGETRAFNWDEALRFVGARVIYDPICLAHVLGYATLAACKAPPAQRAAAERRASRMLAMSDSQRDQYLSKMDASVPQGSYVGTRWLTPAGANVVLPLPAAGLTQAHHVPVAVISFDQKDGKVAGAHQTGTDYRDITLFPEVALRAGQKITGGSLGGWDVFLPKAQRTYRNVADYDLTHIELVDPLRLPRESGIAPYLGPAVLAQYSG